MVFFIVGGTEKAGTTALFNFFYSHPQIIPSIRKETDYFRGDGALSLESYLDQFVQNDGEVYFEASPGYLAESDDVIKSIKKTMLGHTVKLLFILRDPAERLLSSFSFHKSRGYIRDSIRFDDYLDAAIQYRNNGVCQDGISEWALQSVFHGEYADHIKNYIDAFGENVKIVCYDDFKNNPDSVVRSLCDYLGVDKTYFDGFQYFSANKTFKPRFQFVHEQLLKLNRLLEPFFFRYPKVKSYLLGVYKKMNRGEKDQVKENEKSRIVDFYTDSAIELQSVLISAGREVPHWVSRYH